jgi:hypothetical protein
MQPNPPPAANPAVALVVYSILQWRGVAEAERSKTEMHIKFAAILFLLIGLGLTAVGQSPNTNAPQSSAEPAMFDGFYRVDTNTFARMRLLVAATNNQSDSEVLASFFKRKGVSLSPRSLILPMGISSYREKLLLVRSTKENLDKIEKLEEMSLIQRTPKPSPPATPSSPSQKFEL